MNIANRSVKLLWILRMIFHKVLLEKILIYSQKTNMLTKKIITTLVLVLAIASCEQFPELKVTPNYLEVDSSTHEFELHATSPIYTFFPDIYKINPFPETRIVENSEGIYTYDIGWIRVRLNTTIKDSCKIVNVYLRANNTNKKRIFKMQVTNGLNGDDITIIQDKRDSTE